MKILYLISSEINTILTAIGGIIAALSIIAPFAILQADTPEKRKQRTLIFSALGLFFVVAIGAVTAIHFWMMDYGTVPNVVGFSRDDAISILSEENFNASYPSHMDGNAIVSSQNPVDGMVIKTGMTVTLETEISTETGSAEAAIVKKGDIVTFGAYEQDNIRSNGTERIEWLVLDVQKSKALLLSRYALDSQPYNDVYGATNWADCTLRSWLKDVFLKTAFTQEEKSSILMTEVDNSTSQNNSEWNVKGCKNTDDMVFLLSYADTDRYFADQTARVCTPTDYAVSEGAGARTLDDGITDAAWWWLRSPGESSNQASFVNFDGTRYTNAVGNEYLSVRPALWIDLEKCEPYIDIQLK